MEIDGGGGRGRTIGDETEKGWGGCARVRAEETQRGARRAGKGGGGVVVRGWLGRWIGRGWKGGEEE